MFSASFEAESLLYSDHDLGEPCRIGHEVVPPSLSLDVRPYLFKNYTSGLQALLSSKLSHDTPYRRLDHRCFQSTEFVKGSFYGEPGLIFDEKLGDTAFPPLVLASC